MIKAETVIMKGYDLDATDVMRRIGEAGRDKVDLPLDTALLIAGNWLTRTGLPRPELISATSLEEEDTWKIQLVLEGKQSTLVFHIIRRSGRPDFGKIQRVSMRAMS